ncbi:MAG: segregation/condensation protein A [Gammaproteobacteria bacterium]|nr:segregation/condensation protein A [Gammaproteobacteria bacterium]
MAPVNQEGAGPTALPPAPPVVQAELPFAVVQGTPLLEPPRDLYIPPDALEVFLDAFEGPLDLLLYLIKKQNLDVLDIPIARITEQYLRYIEMMQVLRIELAAEYLVMAALLAEIKSRMLLPQSHQAEAEEEDPRAELVRRLQEYERYKKAAQDLDELPREERDLRPVVVEFPERSQTVRPPAVKLEQLVRVFAEVLVRARNFAEHHIQREALSLGERMALVLQRARGVLLPFSKLFSRTEGRAGVVIALMAVLELVKEALLDVQQDDPEGPIYVRAADTGGAGVGND